MNDEDGPCRHAYPTHERPGTIIVDPANHFLYFIHDAGQAIRYGVGVGAEGFLWSGRATVHSKQEWPDWYPPAEMLARQAGAALAHGAVAKRHWHERRSR